MRQWDRECSQVDKKGSKPKKELNREMEIEKSKLETEEEGLVEEGEHGERYAGKVLSSAPTYTHFISFLLYVSSGK